MVKTAGVLGIGLVGSGFMGRSHAFAFASAAQVFDLPLRPELAVLADRDDIHRVILNQRAPVADGACEPEPPRCLRRERFVLIGEYCKLRPQWQVEYLCGASKREGMRATHEAAADKANT